MKGDFKKMRDLLKLFDRRYSAVNISDVEPPITVDNLQYLQQIDFNRRHRKKSLQASRSIKKGFTIVDSFFSQRRDGKRYPKCESRNSSNFQKTYFLYLISYE